MVENQKNQQKYLIVVVFVEELEDTLDDTVSVEFVLEKKLTMENSQG